MLYCDQLQLATPDALYSYGNRYEPALITVKELKDFLPQVQHVLVLGAGLASLLQVMRSKGYSPHFTLVDIDEVILQWAMEFLDDDDPGKIDIACRDAETFVRSNTDKFDLIFLDVFNGISVPDFVVTHAFLQGCKEHLKPGGRLAFNYISSKAQDWDMVKGNFTAVFPKHKVVSKSVNKIFITE